ncbi:MAG TPA: OmpA family protein [Accumulibacter sp.]|uniref:Outer membrane protein II n=1 Tax=Candidatus Accumulibacter cognatus TaxID=2954383 RepID=A0A080MBN0_9PROT|nr:MULTISPECIES: OmpA family protein [Candidatus Accumulibacter]MCC2866430.1 OmpA family protein [Candidatus Accumulibacter phosphatis]KFB78608.1 MAG: Outer membrane protein II [Candidatus Accumulibacter cognatus]MCQ1551433.1 OmpA family protein [Candidatus Accumulibacter phosphatis]HMW55645.1 OmpA family protein [Accumulibacter sp.]HNF90862.1 OmpA family protein [Accumulibacter sp.]
MRQPSRLLWVFALSLAACTRLTSHVVLLPGPDGRTGALLVTSATGAVVLSEPYTGVDVVDGKVAPTRTSAAMVSETYGRLLAMQPARPRVHIVYFEFGQSVPTPESQARLPRILAEVSALSAGEAVVIGHADRVGHAEANEQLSWQRANAIRELLVGAGLAREAITVFGRGEREPAVVTADNVPEPRNRRVELKLR